MTLQTPIRNAARGALFAALLLAIEEATNLILGQPALSLWEVVTILAYYAASFALLGGLLFAVVKPLEHLLALLAATGGFIAAGKAAEELWWRDIPQWEAVAIGYPSSFVIAGVSFWFVRRLCREKPDRLLGLVFAGILFLPAFRAMNINAFGSFLAPEALKADAVLLAISSVVGLTVWRRARQIHPHLDTFLVISTLILALGTGFGRQLSAEEQPRPSQKSTGPDVLLVVIDTLRADHLQSYGHSIPTSPNMDAFAAEGLRFTQAGSPAGWTLPSFGAFATGLYPSGHGAGLNNGEKNTQSTLDANVPTLAEALQAVGYRTGAIVTNPYLKKSFGLARGFDTYSDALGLAHMPMFVQPLRMLNIPVMGGRYFYRPADIMVDEAIDWWSATEGGSRFLMLHLMDPHDPYNPPDAHVEAIGEPHEMDVLNLYDQEIHFTDAELGRLLNVIDSDTVVFITSDHGDEFGEHEDAYPKEHHPFTRHGHTLYEELLHVPLLVRAPNISPGTVDRPVRSFDVVPTILRISGAQQIQTDGHILGEVLGDPTHMQDAPVGAQAIRYGTEKRSVRMGKHKLIETKWGMELYDLESDPRERENIFGSQTAIHDRLFPQLPAERDATESNSIDEETRRQLESLGYMQ
jgi:arylsulfatase A-like enzyme